MSTLSFAQLPSERQVERLHELARAALAAFGVPATSPLTLLKHRENVVFRVDRTDTGAPCVLRVHREGYQTAASIRSELQWMEALAAAGVRTPEVFRGAGGDTVQTVAHSAVPGHRHCDVLGWIDGAPLSGGDAEETYRLLGRLNARLHRHARTWTPPPGFTRQRWDEEGMLGGAALWGSYVDLAGLDAGACALMGRARAKALDRLARYGKGRDRFALIHADLMPDNVLIDRGEPHVIDFDDSGFGWLMYDLATLLAFDPAGPDFDAFRDAWAEGYRTVEPLRDEHLAELDTLIMCRHLVGLGWLHTRAETPFARDLSGVAIAMACAQAERFLSRGTS